MGALVVDPSRSPAPLWDMSIMAQITKVRHSAVTGFKKKTLVSSLTMEKHKEKRSGRPQFEFPPYHGSFLSDLKPNTHSQSHLPYRAGVKAKWRRIM